MPNEPAKNDPVKKPQTFNADEWISKSKAAELRGVSRQAIWELVKRGRLTTFMFERRMYLYRSEVMNFTRNPRGPSERYEALKAKNFDTTKWLSKVEAGFLAGITTQAISDLIRRRRLRTMESSGKTLVQRSSLDKFIEAQQELKPSKLSPRIKIKQARKK
jgi:predicted DNA-binding protein YlxM (UPF0122 family)